MYQILSISFGTTLALATVNTPSVSNCDPSGWPFPAIINWDCQTLKAACKDWFSKSPDTQQFARPFTCSSGSPDTVDSVLQSGVDLGRACAISLGKAVWGEVVGTAALVGKAISSGAACESGDLGAKRLLVRAALTTCPDRPNTSSPHACTDAELASLSCSNLQARAQNYEREAQGTQDELNHVEQLEANYLKITGSAGGPTIAQGLTEDRIKKLAASAIEQSQAALQCYTARAQTKLVCSAVGSLINPALILSGGAGAVLKGAEWASVVLKGTAGADEAMSVINGGSTAITLSTARQASNLAISLGVADLEHTTTPQKLLSILKSGELRTGVEKNGGKLGGKSIGKDGVFLQARSSHSGGMTPRYGVPSLHQVPTVVLKFDLNSLDRSDFYANAMWSWEGKTASSVVPDDSSGMYDILSKIGAGKILQNEFVFQNPVLLSRLTAINVPKGYRSILLGILKNQNIAAPSGKTWEQLVTEVNSYVPSDYSVKSPSEQDFDP